MVINAFILVLEYGLPLPCCCGLWCEPGPKVHLNCVGRLPLISWPDVGKPSRCVCVYGGGECEDVWMCTGVSGCERMRAHAFALFILSSGV